MTEFIVRCPQCGADSSLTFRHTKTKVYTLTAQPSPQNNGKGIYLYTHAGLTERKQTQCSACDYQIEGSELASRVVVAG